MKTVLIVDDDKTFQDLISLSVKRGGYAPFAVADAQQALDYLHNQHPDAIILDDMMPGMMGSELCTSLKADPITKSIPVIIYTAGVRFFMLDGFSRTGADAVLTKNGKLGELLDTLRQLVPVAV